PQTQPMSVGSAFDAKVKSELATALFGCPQPELEYPSLFEAQVEEHNRDWAKGAGEHAFRAYKFSGMYEELLGMLENSRETPEFESEVSKTILGVPLKGFPDLRFIHECGVRVILDWKVKGFCSKTAASPTKGYRLCMDGQSGKPSRSHEKAHKHYLGVDHNGLEVNKVYMEDCSTTYADQLSLYGWLLGEKVGDEDVCLMIEELVWKNVGGEYPVGRVANHRARVRKEHQVALLARFKNCWKAVQSGHVFTDLPREENDQQCLLMERTARQMRMSGTENDAFIEATRA
ncbi:MAG: hypothetical protein KDA84_13995, partial [Planctomycetaceae bacterium]|nr:hypothetical protein [Planctomycetaceae bacterium]